MEKETIIELLKKENSALRESNSQLQASILSMGKSKRRESLLKSRISHDIRTPMNAIVGFTSLAKEEDNTPKTQICLNRIEEATTYLLKLLNEFMEDSRVEVIQKEFSILTLLQEMKEIFEKKMKEKHTSFLLLQDEMNTDKVIGNEMQMKQVLAAVLNHAVSLSKENQSIILHVKTLNESDETSVICFTVKDNAEGLNNQYIEKVFLPFEEEENSKNVQTDEKRELLVISSLVSLLNGVIKVESKAGGGTLVAIEVPFKKRSREKESSKKEAGIYQFKNKRVLLAEDNQLNCEIVENYLKQVNLCVDIAENGREVVKIFENSEPGYYSLILMDIRMPVMDGRTAAQKIRHLPRKDSQIPIVAMSADAYSEEIKYAQSVGMNGYLTKPIYKEVLYRAIEKHLG